MEDRKLILKYITVTLMCMMLFSGYTFPADAPHVHLVNDGVEYDIYFAGSNYRDAFIYDDDAHILINCYSSSITGYTVYQGTQRTVSFPTYDYGNMRITDTYPYSYIYFNNVTECDFYGFSEFAFWKNDIEIYLLVVICILSFFSFLRR